MGFSAEEYFFQVTNLIGLESRHRMMFEHLGGQGEKLLLKVFAEESWKYILNLKMFLLIIYPFLCGL
jgi:hypothetical protein